MSKEVSFKNRQVLSISLDTFYTNKNYVASEFIEKAILFYIGYLSQQDNLNYISPMITETVKAQINGTEQRLTRLLFKVAVELGKLTHLLAAANDVDDETIRQLLVMCINELHKSTVPLTARILSGIRRSKTKAVIKVCLITACT